MSKIDVVRIRIVKEMLDEFPAVRNFARGYLEVYYPEKE